MHLNARLRTGWLSRSPGRHSLAAVMMTAAALLAAGAPPARGQDEGPPREIRAALPDATGSSSPATRGDSAGPAATQPGRNPHPADFTDAEWQTMVEVMDGTANMAEPACAVLLSKLANIKIDQAKAVTLAELNFRPEAFRGQAVRMQLQFHDSMEGRAASLDGTRKAFFVRAVVGKAPRADPVVLICPLPPPKMHKLQHFEVIGYFYKQATYKVEGAGETVDAPVIVAAQINPEVAPAAPSASPSARRVVIYIAILGLMLGGWLVLRARMSRRRTVMARAGYRSMRHDMTPEELEQTKIVIPPADPPVDPTKPDSREVGGTR